jgi:hypothetical protein
MGKNKARVKAGCIVLDIENCSFNVTRQEETALFTIVGDGLTVEMAISGPTMARLMGAFVQTALDCALYERTNK